MVIVKYLCKGTGLANIPVSNIPVCLLKNVVKQVSQLRGILSQKRPHDREDKGETNPTEKKKKTDGPDETQSGSTAATSKVQVEQIATEIQSAESESPNSKISVKLDTILKKLVEMTLTANKQSVAHKPGEYDEVSAVKILV